MCLCGGNRESYPRVNAFLASPGSGSAQISPPKLAVNQVEAFWLLIVQPATTAHGKRCIACLSGDV